MMSATPRELGYRFPAEWEPQAAVWFAWPKRDDLWSGCLDRVRTQLVNLYALAARFQDVRILCPEGLQADLNARLQVIGASGRIELFDYEVDDVWCRDYGPLFLLGDHKGSALALADWKYNAWGDKFPLQERDNAASAWIAERLGVRRFAIDSVLEGGAVESNGAGDLLTTEAVLLNPTRNGVVSKQEVEGLLAEGLAVERVHWLQDGLLGDDTDGHVDNLARFYGTNSIVMAEPTNDADPNRDVLWQNLQRARNFRNADGEPFEVVGLRLPSVMESDGQPLAASYLNYLVLNGAVLVPTYGQPESDAQALEVLAECFPGREVVGFDCCDIIREGGAIHCMSQHQPL